MTLQELLEELRENILRDISDAVQTDSDSFLLSDKALVRYINDAQSKFASRTLCLRDETTPEVTRITLVAGQAVYALDRRVVTVYGVTAPARRSLKSTTYAFLTGTRGDMALGNAVLTCETTGDPVYFYTDRETQKIGLYPAPSVEFVADNPTLTLRVARLPLTNLVASDLQAVPEVPEQYHLDMLEWAAYRALMNSDIEIESLPKASVRRRRFEDTVTELQRESKRLLMRELQFNVNTNWSAC